MEKFERADPSAFANFDPRTKVCTMNCGPTVGDPRSPEERRFLCPDCVTVPVPNADNAMRAVPKDAPVMTAWNNYKSCDDYQNTRKWALHEEHVDGSLWASFYAGYFACAVDTTSAPHSASQPVEGLVAKAAAVIRRNEQYLRSMKPHPNTGYFKRSAEETIAVLRGLLAYLPEPQSAEATAAGIRFCCAKEEKWQQEIGKLRNVIQRGFHLPEVKAAYDEIMGEG